MPFDDLLADFHTQLAALGSRGRGTRYPPEFIEHTGTLVTLLREHGWTQNAIAQTLEISWPTLLRWSSPAEDAPSFAPIEVVECEPSTTPSTSTLTLVTPTGWRLEGLELERAVELLDRWSC